METFKGFAAISAYNGWMMAVIGISIVMLGLAGLAAVISLFPKLVSFIEARKAEREEHTKAGELGGVSVSDRPFLPAIFPEDPHAVAEIYEFLLKDLGTEFELSQLYAAARKYNYPHPHLSIRQLREAGILTAVQDGIFRWNQ